MVRSTSPPKPSVLKPFLPVSHVNWLLLLLPLLLQCLHQLRSGVVDTERRLAVVLFVCVSLR